jgi:hypothetical protein
METGMMLATFGAGMMVWGWMLWVTTRPGRAIDRAVEKRRRQGRFRRMIDVSSVRRVR